MRLFCLNEGMINCFPEEERILAEVKGDPQAAEAEVDSTQRLAFEGQGVFTVDPETTEEVADLFEGYKEAQVFFGSFVSAKEGADIEAARLDIGRPSRLKTLSSKILGRTVATKITVTAE